MIQRIYFGHPISFYDIPKEDELVKCLEREFPSLAVENPNQPQHQAGYKRFQETKGRGMLYFFEEVLPAMAAGAFLTFEDGKFGAGVWGEAEFLHQQGKPIYEMNIEGRIATMTLDVSRMLSVDETRSRVYDKDRKIIKYAG